MSDWPTQPTLHSTYTPSDSTNGPLFPPQIDTPSWLNDGFLHDPGFLASQEELRCMLFTIAQSRAASPEVQIEEDERSRARENALLLRPPVLFNARRVGYLKNYVGEVAPWVRSPGV